MNSDDFRRNFQQSYFAIHANHLKRQFKPDEWSNLDFSSGPPMIPATTPHYLDSTSNKMGVTIVYKFSGGSECYDKVVQIPWKRDLDEDRSYMITKAPRLGMIQDDETAVYIRRRPIRSFNRGYCPRHCTSYLGNPILSRNLNRFPLNPGTYLLVWRVYNPVRYSFEEGLNILERGEKIGVVVAPMVSIVLEMKRKWPLVVYRGDVVGFVQNGGITVYDNVGQGALKYLRKNVNAEIKIKG